MKHFTVIIDLKEVTAPSPEVQAQTKPIRENSEFGKAVKVTEDVAHFVFRAETQTEAIGKAIRLLDTLRNVDN